MKKGAKDPSRKSISKKTTTRKKILKKRKQQVGRSQNGSLESGTCRSGISVSHTKKPIGKTINTRSRIWSRVRSNDNKNKKNSSSRIFKSNKKKSSCFSYRKINARAIKESLSKKTSEEPNTTMIGIASTEETDDAINATRTAAGTYFFPRRITQKTKQSQQSRKL